MNANIYGLGEVVSSSGFRRNVETTIQTMWARDIPVPVDENLWSAIHYLMTSLSLTFRLVDSLDMVPIPFTWNIDSMKIPAPPNLMVYFYSGTGYKHIKWTRIVAHMIIPSNLSAAGGDILLFTPPSSKVSLVEYRMIGGVLDFYFFSGPTPNKVIEQYGALIGLPIWQPAWGFGFHLCRYVTSCFMYNAL